MVEIILQNPIHSANVGAVARIMKNFGFERLVLIKPKCVLDEDAFRLARHANEILENTQILEALPNYDLLVGMTAKLGSENNLTRTPLSPRDVAQKIRAAKGTIGLLFGPEDSGLSNELLHRCQMVCSIPTQTEYAAMNLAQSVSILLYELSLARKNNTILSTFTLANNNQQDQLQKLINESLDTMTFSTEQKKATQELLWHNIIGKSALTTREAQALLGFFKKIIGRR